VVVPEAVLWQRDSGPVSKPTLILPDGCLDLLWDGRRLAVAGPDRTARRHQSADPAKYVALRFYGGIGPGLLGVPADELTDQTVDFGQISSSAEARTLAERAAVDPAGALTAWLVERVGEREPDAFGARVFAMAGAGLPVESMAERVGMSVRQLHRRCLPLFGYGPRHLTRVLRLVRALDQAATGHPLAQVAAGAGYCDQAHLSREVRALASTTPTRLLEELGLG
jgi:AraC-like DNA-binding protein